MWRGCGKVIITAESINPDRLLKQLADASYTFGLGVHTCSTVYVPNFPKSQKDWPVKVFLKAGFYEA